MENLPLISSFLNVVLAILCIMLSIGLYLSRSLARSEQEVNSVQERLIEAYGAKDKTSQALISLHETKETILVDLLQSGYQLVGEMHSLIPDGSAATEEDYVAWSKRIDSNQYWNLQEQAFEFLESAKFFIPEDEDGRIHTQDND